MERYMKSLVFSILLFFSTQMTTSYVVKNWVNHRCLDKYLYMGFIPHYFIENRNSMFPLNKEDVFICQRLNDKEYFFTRYSKLYRIPIYSAYKIHSFQIQRNVKVTKWSEEKGLTEQAINADYTNSGYDRGHLNPRSFNRYSVESVNATYTLTNAVPMTGSFNKAWYREAEGPLFTKMKTECNFENARRYVITGVIPGKLLMRQKVNIPDVIWTAACCDTTEVVKSTPDSWSIGYLMNATDNFYNTFTIQQLEQHLMLLLPNTVVRLFKMSTNRQSGCNINDLKRKRKRT